MINEVNEKSVLECSRLKKELRKDMRGKIKKKFLFAEQINSAAKKATELFLDSDMYIHCEYLFTFVSMKNEIDTSLLIEQAVKDNKKIVLPRVLTGSQLMNFYILDSSISLADQLEITEPYKIKEPVKTLSKIYVNHFPEKSVFIIPGLAFSEDGRRLGKGCGFYDIYLSKLKASCSKKNMPTAFIGFGYSFQLIQNIPVCTTDFRLTHIITDQGIIQC